MALDLQNLFALSTPGLASLIAISFMLALIVSIVLWVYTSLAFTAIGRRAKISYPGLSWIPFTGPLITTFRISKMHWWPWLLLIGLLIPVLNIAAFVIFAIFAYIWMWKTFKAVKRPGWWALIPIGNIIPVIGLVFSIAFFVLVGIAAWGRK